MPAPAKGCEAVKEPVTGPVLPCTAASAPNLALVLEHLVQPCCCGPAAMPTALGLSPGQALALWVTRAATSHVLHQPRSPLPSAEAQRCEAVRGCGAVTAGGEGWQPRLSLSLQGSRGAAARRELQPVLVPDGCCSSRALGWCLQAARAPQPGCRQRPGLLLWVSAPRACRARGPQSPGVAVLPSRGEGLSRWLGSQHRASA